MIFLIIEVQEKQELSSRSVQGEAIMPIFYSRAVGAGTLPDTPYDMLYTFSSI